ncbi:hypothetical protein M231_07687 [Tremella mesenterica]|uniref:Uncharacterized protein n=1 Tax=Tremella mesenterica TaxID=5217 RepID=A0A4Q1BAM2_TREME|nr:hypothetical protein M231_07687 [Tremella mesenterica]
MLEPTGQSLLSTNTSFPPTAPGNASISNLPNWTIPLHKLTTLTALLSGNIPQQRSRSAEKRYVNLMVCVMSVDTPVLRSRKEEKAKGKNPTLWVGSWNVTSPPSHNEGEVASCSVKLWEGLAREWGDERVRRGDVVYLENVEFKPTSAKEQAQLVLSPTTGRTPQITILYRTLPRYKSARSDYVYGRNRARAEGDVQLEDASLRPNLELGRSDAGIRRVKEYARWLAEWVEGEPPP